MAFFGIGRKDDVLDLTEKFRREQAQAREIKQEAGYSAPSSSTTQTTEAAKPAAFSPFGSFFGGTNTAKAEEPKDDGYINVSTGMTASTEEKKRKLAKRLVDMTNRIEEMDNKIYHLQQRIEVLEKKGAGGIGF